MVRYDVRSKGKRRCGSVIFASVVFCSESGARVGMGVVV